MNNVNQTPSKPPAGTPVPKAPKLTFGGVAKLYVDKGKEFLTLAKSRLSSDPKMKRLLLIAGGAFGVIFLLLIVTAVAQSIIKRGNGKEVPTPTPAFSASPEPTVFNPSRYATDSAVLSLEESVKGINRDAESLDIREYNLRPPALDYDINFQPTQ